MLIAEVVLLVLGVAGIVTACSPFGHVRPERFLLGAAALFAAAFLASIVSGARGWKRPRLRVSLLVAELCGAALAMSINSSIITF